MSEMRAKLDAGLKDPSRPIEEQERTIEWVTNHERLICPLCDETDIGRILIELDQSDEPAWTYLEYQHAHIMEVMRSLNNKALERAKGGTHPSYRVPSDVS